MSHISAENSYTSPIVYVVAFVLATHMFTFPFIDVPILADSGPSWLGLDVSWQMTLSYANLHDLVWGKDIVYTYGPLGFLSTRIAWGVSRWFFLAFDLFLMVNFFHVFKDFLKASMSKVLGVLILFAATLLMHTNHGTDLSWLLLFFIYYWLYKTHQKPTNSSYAMLLILAVISLFVKVNAGLIGMCVICAHLAMLYVSQKISLLKGVSIIAILTGCIFLAAWVLNVNILAYIHGAFEIIKGYPGIMYMDNGQERVEENLGTLYAMIKYLFIIFFIYIMLKGKFTQFFYLAIAAGFILLLKKQAFLRGDVQHLSEFFCYAPIVLLVGNFLYFKTNTQKVFSAAILFIFTISLFFKAEFYNNIDGLFKNRYTNKKEYYRQFKESKNVQYLEQRDKRYIPDTILAKVGNATIDIFPWDTEYLMENKLNFSPRPIFQSFSAYTKYLQELNYEHYVNDGPEYIIYDYESIDGRYPFNDEAMLNMFILKNYTLEDTFTSNERTRSLLKRKKLATGFMINKVSEAEYGLLDKVTIPNNVNFIRLVVDENWEGKKLSFKLRPPELNMAFNTENGHSQMCKISPELLKAGIQVETLVLTHENYLSLLTKNSELSKIKSIQLKPTHGFFEEKIKVEFYNLK